MPEPIPFARPSWRKTSYSGSSDCVLVGRGPRCVLVCDSAAVDGPVLHVSLAAWQALTSGIHRSASQR